jgi:hypothetical protein
MSKLVRNVWLSISLLLLYLSINIHGKTPVFNYRSEIFADKAGYYVYLPAFFLYNFDARNFPEGVDLKSGNGFSFLAKADETEKRIVFTKYPMGVALMDMPFFLLTHAYCKVTNTPADGFSAPYFRMRTFTNSLYTLMGLGLILLWLKRKYDFSDFTLISSFLLLLLGSNLLYYTVKDVGLSHNYSFFLIACFLNVQSNPKYVNRLGYPVVLGIVIGLLLLVRPINAVFMVLLLLWDIPPVGPGFREKVKTYFWAGLVAVLMFVPQLIYYRYSLGAMISYSYGNETFVYAKNPKIFHVLFAFENGWLTNNPVFLTVFFGLILMFKRKIQNGWIILGLIVAITWLYASWWSWELGCAYGHRAFIEFYPILMVPLALSLDYLKKVPYKGVLPFAGVFFLLAILYNLKLTFAYDGCWLGRSPFDFQYWKLLLFHTGFVK